MRRNLKYSHLVFEEKAVDNLSNDWVNKKRNKAQSFGQQTTTALKSKVRFLVFNLNVLNTINCKTLYKKL